MTFERAVDFAKKNGIHKCFETSAATGEIVETLFSCAGKELYQKEKLKAELGAVNSVAAATQNNVNLGSNNPTPTTPAKKGGCC